MAINKKQLFIIGELNVDLLLNNLNALPEVGKEIVAGSSSLVLGSSSAIMAANSAAIDVDTAFCGIVGNDLYGNLILDQLQKSNIDTRFIKKTKKSPTGITVIMNYDQDRANVTYCGAMEILTIQDIPWSKMAKYRHLHISSFFLQKKLKGDVTTIFKKAKIMGLTTSLDLQWDPNEKWDFDYKACLPFVDVFLPNRQELLALTNTSLIEEGIAKIIPFSNCVAIKLGQEGSLGIQGDERLAVPGFKSPGYTDSIGAGDSFNSGFIKKFMEKAPLEECLKYGNLMGALSTTDVGGTKAFENRESIAIKIKLILESSLD
tara:strand:- start:19 stop:972 length:954 start_codon:yes stop_codon:yes gene_type:complete